MLKDSQYTILHLTSQLAKNTDIAELQLLRSLLLLSAPEMISNPQPQLREMACLTSCPPTTPLQQWSYKSGCWDVGVKKAIR